MFSDDPLTEAEVKRLWLKAYENCQGDAAEMYFQAAQSVGEARLKKVGQWDFYERTRTLPAYSKALESVRECCRRYCELELGLKGEAQRDQDRIQEALLLEGVRRANTDAERVAAMHRRSAFFKAAFLGGDLNFFRKLGAALSTPPRKHLGDHELAHTLLNYWVSRFLWLMDGKTLASAVAQIHKIDEPGAFEATVKKSKVRWKLESTKPALICGFKTDGQFVLSSAAKRLFSK
jgi:hypothetical protein